MVKMNERLRSDEALADAYARAHEAYIASRDALGEDVPEITGVSAGGMPTRVKCLHALLGHALAAGRGINPLGDEVVDAIGEFWTKPCLADDEATRASADASPEVAATVGAPTGPSREDVGNNAGNSEIGNTEDPCE
jgi:hypothetical protein